MGLIRLKKPIQAQLVAVFIVSSGSQSIRNPYFHSIKHNISLPITCIL